LFFPDLIDQAVPFNVTYLVGDQSTRSIVDGIDLSSLDLAQVAQSVSEQRYSLDFYILFI